MPLTPTAGNTALEPSPPAPTPQPPIIPLDPVNAAWQRDIERWRAQGGNCD